MAYTTTCFNIVNLIKNVNINVIDQEHSSELKLIASGEQVTFDGQAIPWCNNNEEVLSKAYRVDDIDKGNTLFYIFMDYTNDVICYSCIDYVHTNPSMNQWDLKSFVNNSETGDVPLSKTPSINLFINKDYIFGLQTEDKNPISKEALAAIKKATNYV